MSLVQIQLNSHNYNGKRVWPITTPRPREVTDLVDALSRMWGRLGVHEICRRCFAGKLGRPAGRGCCGSCPNLGHASCMAKPVGCATYFCGIHVDNYSHPALKDLPISPYLQYLRHFLYGEQGLFAFGRSPYRGLYASAVESEAQREYSTDELKMLRVARWAVDNWATT